MKKQLRRVAFKIMNKLGTAGEALIYVVLIPVIIGEELLKGLASLARRINLLPWAVVYVLVGISAILGSLVMPVLTSAAPPPQIIQVTRVVTPTPVALEQVAAVISEPTPMLTPELVEPTPVAQDPGQPVATIPPKDQDREGFQAPEPVEVRTFECDGINVVLLGSDHRPGQSQPPNMDTIVIVSVCKTGPTVRVLHVTRDLWLWVPGWGPDRINRAWLAGVELLRNGGGPRNEAEELSAGFAKLKETLLYNFGLRVDYYAVVEIQGLWHLIDAVGPIEVVAYCEVHDTFPILTEGESDIASGPLDEVPSFDLDIDMPSVYTLDGLHAQAYARSRKTDANGVFGRQWRTEQVLRAIFAKLLVEKKLENIGSMWDTAVQYVKTDLTLNDVLWLADIGQRINPAQVRTGALSKATGLSDWVSPGGGNVYQYDWPQVETYLNWLYEAIPTNVASQSPLVVDVVNNTPSADREKVAADFAARNGFRIGQVLPNDRPTGKTFILDHTTSSKGSRLEELIEVFNVDPANVLYAPNEYAQAAYTLYVGTDWDPCASLTGSQKK